MNWDVVWAVVVGNFLTITIIGAYRIIVAATVETWPKTPRHGKTAKQVEMDYRRAMTRTPEDRETDE